MFRKAAGHLPLSHFSPGEWMNVSAYAFLLSPKFLESPTQLTESTLHKCQTESQINAFHSVAQGNVQTEHYFTGAVGL